MSGLLKKLFKTSGRRRDERLFCSAVIVAAGSGARMNGINKIFADIDGEPVIVHTMRAFELCPDVDEIVVVARPEEIGDIGVLINDYDLTKVTKVVRGGRSRQDPSYRAYGGSPKSTCGDSRTERAPSKRQEVSPKCQGRFRCITPRRPVYRSRITVKL